MLNFEGTKFHKNDGTCNYFSGFTPKKSVDVEKILINSIYQHRFARETVKYEYI
jgi:hypothetical protein